MTETQIPTDMETFIVWTAMGECASHAHEQVPVDRTILIRVMIDSGDPAHS